MWSMKHNQNILTQKVYKRKAWLNTHGGKQTYRVNYTETCLPKVNWITIQLLLSLVFVNDLKSQQVDFVLDSPQTDIECNVNMELS